MAGEVMAGGKAPNLQGTEAAFLEQVVVLAHACGWLVHHDRPAVDGGGRWASHIQGDVGFPDLVLAKRGQVLFWELKVGHATLTTAQKAWLMSLWGPKGVQVTMLTPNDWDYIERTLKEAP